MFLFEKSSPDHIELEESILNSDTYFNFVSKGKELFSTEEILTEIKNGAKIGAERFIIKEKIEPVAILEYLMENPSDKCTWLGLLQIKKDYQGKGYGTRILQQFEQILASKHVKKYRIGVIAENQPALQFWQIHHFQRVNSITNEDQKEFIIFEKEI